MKTAAPIAAPVKAAAAAPVSDLKKQGEKVVKENPILAWVCTGLFVLVVLWVVIGIFRALFGRRPSPGPMGGPGMGGGYGQGGGYGGGGGGYGGGGGGGPGFFGTMMAGMFGAAAGSWLYDKFSHGGGVRRVAGLRRNHRRGRRLQRGSRRRRLQRR